MRSAAVVLLAVALTPAAAACQFAERPPAPGAFIVWDGATDETVAFEVADRRLAGDCSLANLHALDGDRFAWLEGRVLRVADVTTGEVTEFALRHDRYEAIELAGEILLHVPLEGNGIHGRAFALNLTTGEDVPLPVPEENGGRNLRLSGSLVFVTERVGERDEVSAYDAHQDAWLFRNLTAEDLHMPAQYVFRAGNHEWMLWGWQDEARLYNVTSGSTHPAPSYDPERRLSLNVLEGGSMYGAAHERNGSWTLYRVALPDGGLQRLVTLPHPFLGAVDGQRAVFGEYTAPWAAEEAGEEGGPRQTPGAGTPGALLGLAALAGLSSRRRPPPPGARSPAPCDGKPS